MKNLSLLIIVLFLSGCATGPGTNAWHKSRMKEIELSYQNKQITMAEYISLKNEIDGVSANYKSNIASGILSKPSPSPTHIYVTPTQ